MRVAGVLAVVGQSLGIALFFLAHGLALLMIPLGLPGTWVQVAAAAGMTIASGGTLMGWGWTGLCVALALLGEVVEFLSGQWGTRRFGGSRAAGWGALLGGLVGAFVGGIPVPVVGSVIASFLGTFAGALAGEMWAERALAARLHVGWGAVVGRVVGVATKLSLAFVMLIVSGAVLLAQLVGG